MVKAANSWILLCPILLLTFCLRIQGVERLPEGHFTETDAYLYYWQADVIREDGKLPARDMHRWLPLGRENGQTLNLYSYALAYAEKAVGWLFPSVTLYQVCIYMPVVCFCIGLSALCLFLYHTHGILFSGSVCILLATLPGSIERSTAGFGDRDAWCLMIGLLVVITYLMSLQTQHQRKRLFWTLASGSTVFLGGISWEGFGVFLSVILFVELWRFLTTETENNLCLYLLWVLSFVPTLYLASPAYRNGYGFAEHLFAFVLVPPVVLLGVRGLRYLLLSEVEKLRPHARTLSLGLALASIALAIGYVLIQHSTFADTTVPLSRTSLMQVMSELKSPGVGYWVFRYGSVFIVGSLGFAAIPLCLWKKQGLFLSILLAVFAVASFFRQPLDSFWGVAFGNALFGTALAGCVVALTLLAWRRENKAPSEVVFIAFIVWFLVWVALARDARRYDFFIGVALSYGSAAFLVWLSQGLGEKIWHWFSVRDQFRFTFKNVSLNNGVAVLLLFCLLCLPINHAHTYRAVFAAKQMRKVLPENTDVQKALHWMNAALPKTAVVAAHWRYGSQLNVLGGVKTITDQDTYIQHWIYLYYKHIIHARTEREALEFMKTHGATHLMLVGQKPATHFLRGQRSDAFVPVYPTAAFAEANVNVWELHYPPEIENDSKYLLTGIPEIDGDLQSR
ncbi:hypothetical protein C6496_15560 [Candidatus Poribacteria bacterium]|nr:MAG: hypothetical protein C6496_15560 [Candidatus Poribacteria bacterium]